MSSLKDYLYRYPPRYVSSYDLGGSWSPDCSHTRAAAIAPKPPIDITKDVQRKGVTGRAFMQSFVSKECGVWLVRHKGTGTATDCALTLELLAERWENSPEEYALKLDLTKPIRVKDLNEERKITVDPYGGYTAYDLGGTQRCAGLLSAKEIDDLYENFVREVYKFEFSDGIASVRPGKNNSGGPTILLGIKAETSNPAITFTKTMSKGKVKELRDNLTKWLESVG